MYRRTITKGLENIDLDQGYEIKIIFIQHTNTVILSGTPYFYCIYLIKEIYKYTYFTRCIISTQVLFLMQNSIYRQMYQIIQVCHAYTLLYPNKEYTPEGLCWGWKSIATTLIPSKKHSSNVWMMAFVHPQRPQPFAMESTCPM